MNCNFTLQVFYLVTVSCSGFGILGVLLFFFFILCSRYLLPQIIVYINRSGVAEFLPHPPTAYFPDKVVQ